MLTKLHGMKIYLYQIRNTEPTLSTTTFEIFRSIETERNSKVQRLPRHFFRIILVILGVI